MDYDHWLKKFTGKVEKIIFRLTLLLVVILFISQAVLLNDTFKPYLEYTSQLRDRVLLEDFQEVISGTVEREHSHEIQEPALLLELITPAGGGPLEFTILVNDKPQAFLSEQKILLQVSPGDLIEIEGDIYGNKPAIVRVVDVYGELQAPAKGLEIKTFGERELIAWIIP